MTTQSSRVPVLSPDGRFPDKYAPPSVALDTAVAVAAKNDAVLAKGDAEEAANDARETADGIPAAVADAVTAADIDGKAATKVDESVIAQDIPGQASTAVGSAVANADIPALVADAAGPIVASEVALQLPALIHPLGSANNPITDAAAVRPEFPKVFWQTSVEPVHWLDGDEWVEVAL